MGGTPLPLHGPAAPHPLPQIFNDTLSDTCIRISQEERLRLKSLFGNPRPHPHVPLLLGWGAPDLGGPQHGGLTHSHSGAYPCLLGVSKPQLSLLKAGVVLPPNATSSL